MSKRVGAGVAVFVVRDDGSFLMGQRAATHGGGTWSVPGGWMDYGESWQQAAAREVAEETGLIIEGPVEFVAATNNLMLDEDTHSVTIWLKTPYQGGDPQILEPDKFVNQGWYSFEKLPEPLFMPWRSLLSQDFDITISAK